MLDIPPEGNPGISVPKLPKTKDFALSLLALAMLKFTSELALFPPKIVALRLVVVEGQ